MLSIKAPNVDHFSPTDVRLAYLALKNDPSLDPDVVRRKVYLNKITALRNYEIKN